MLNVSRDSTGLDSSAIGATHRPPTIRHQRDRKSGVGQAEHGSPALAGVSYLKAGTSSAAITPVVVSHHKSKRALDIVVAGGGLLVLWPVMLLIAAVVVSTSRGGALFAHERIGRNGRAFKLYKFRSMRAGTAERVQNDPELRARYEANNFKLDAKSGAITRVGRFLRKSSLDELPQLWNVLVGNMSLVGVRPLVADELAARKMHDQRLYMSLAPGLTGLWQVEGRSSIVGVERVELDRRYVEQWSFWNDVRILARTPLAVLRPANTH